MVIKENDANLAFATAGCGGSVLEAAVFPSSNAREQEMIAEWKKHKLDDGDFPSGHAMVFLKAIKRILDL